MNLAPLEYSRNSEYAAFECANFVVSVGYKINTPKSRLRPKNPVANIAVSLDGQQFALQYEVPRTYKIGEEIGAVERGIYELLDDALRYAGQKTAICLRLLKILSAIIRAEPFLDCRKRLLTFLCL